MTQDKLVAILAALAAAVLPVLVNDGVLTGVWADLVGALVGTFVVGYHVPNSKAKRDSRTAKHAA